MKHALIRLFGVIAFFPLLAGEETCFETKFTPDWDKTHWEMVRSSRFDWEGSFLQSADAIENRVPADAAAQEMRSSRAGETYAAMVLKERFDGNFRIECTMEFLDRMAPGIVLAADPVVNAKGKPEFREHWEAILFDNGLNVWHHVFVGGKQKWTLADHLGRAGLFAPEVKHHLTVTVKRKSDPERTEISVECDGFSTGYAEKDFFPGPFRIGIVAGEGVNRFYDFKVVRLD
ncbi:MAG: hypothetical protein MJ016_02465 [Victivallaceae bacterium]|nr:hypothetical protein [Victivallaceae bacterium]